jgi:hypothetical protein
VLLSAAYVQLKKLAEIPNLTEEIGWDTFESGDLELEVSSPPLGKVFGKVEALSLFSPAASLVCCLSML